MAPGVSSCHYREVPPSISFSGSGFMSTYQLGVAQCFLTYTPWILRTAPHVLGASAGSLVAAAVVCEISPISIRNEMLNFAKEMKTFTLGPLNPSVNVFHWLEYILNIHIPSNAHQLANGRLAVAVTRMADCKLTIISDFESKEDVINALLCSCFVPGYCGMMPPSFKGVHYVDGGFSSMQPSLPVPCNQILTVSPFSGETDICPADMPSMWDMVVSGSTLKGNMANSIRILNALYPMTLEALEKAYDSGYKDAMNFLLSNDLVPYMMIHEDLQAPLNCSQSTMWRHHETDIKKEEEEVKPEKEIATVEPPSGTRCQQRGSSPGYSTGEKPPLDFGLVKNALLTNVMMYMSMFGLPAWIISRLLLPLILSFHATLQSRQRLGLGALAEHLIYHNNEQQWTNHTTLGYTIKLETLFREGPELGFWVWQGLRYHTLFVVNIFVSSIKKNIKDRIMPLILLLSWVKIRVQVEATKGQRHTTLFQRFPSTAHSEGIWRGSLHRRFTTS